MLRGRFFSTALLVAALGLASVLLSACDSGPAPVVATPVPTMDLSASPTEGMMPTLVTPTPVPTPAGLTDADAANIYAAVIDSLLGEKVPPVVYISPYIGRGERLDDPDESQPLPQSILSALPASSDTKYQFNDFSAVIGPLDSGGAVQDNGVFITLGAITADPANNDTVSVRGSLYRKVGDALGESFHLKRDQAASYGWRILDSTQEWSDS